MPKKTLKNTKVAPKEAAKYNAEIEKELTLIKEEFPSNEDFNTAYKVACDKMRDKSNDLKHALGRISRYKFIKLVETLTDETTEDFTK